MGPERISNNTKPLQPITPSPKDVAKVEDKSGNYITLTNAEFLQLLLLAERLASPDNGLFGNIEIRPATPEACGTPSEIEITIVEDPRVNQNNPLAGSYSPAVKQVGGLFTTLLELLKTNPQARTCLRELITQQNSMRCSQ